MRTFIFKAMAQQISEQEEVRRAALTRLCELGIDPYPAAEFKTNATAENILAEFEDESKAFEDVILAGRLMGKRIMGKASFAQLRDHTGNIQVYFNRDELCPGEDKTMYNEVFKRLLDLGDFIGVRGHVFRTKVGEVSVHVKELTILSKSLKPLPVVKTDDEGNVHDAFTDPELRYRQRYVDLVVNPQVKETFIQRTRIIDTMRRFMNDKGYLEVETPVLQPIPGGAAARPFITHHNALDIPLYLRVANELYLKRLIVGGFDGVYEFSRDFRNEGMDRTHNPEFTIMELYVAYKDYFWMMDFVEEMIEKAAVDLHGKTQVEWNGEQIDLKRPFRRLTMYDAIKEYAGVDISKMSEAEVFQTAKDLGVEVDDSMGRGKLIDEIFGEKCEANLVQPTFLIDYPIEMSPLCKRHRDNPELTERFELIIGGKEMANAYSELNDPIDQRERFEEQVKLMERGDDEAMFIDQDFLRALEYGMPPTSGVGIGLDRLVMMLTNNSSIQEVLFFPQMKPEKVEVKKEDGTEAFEAIGVPKEWSSTVQETYITVEALREKKATQVHQALNGLRKKKKLEIDALQLDAVSAWFE